MSMSTRLAELRKDLLHPSGPAISTNRNYPFAIFQYTPFEEFAARAEVGNLAQELQVKGWRVRTVDLFAVLADHLSLLEDGRQIEMMIAEEKLQYRANREDYTKPLDYLGTILGETFKDLDGFPGRVLAQIQEVAAGADPARTVIFLSRVGALYPFYRTSSLLRFLDAGVKVPTVVLYPGTRVEQQYLSFMGEMDADRDYRPRIY